MNNGCELCYLSICCVLMHSIWRRWGFEYLMLTCCVTNAIKSHSALACSLQCTSTILAATFRHRAQFQGARMLPNGTQPAPLSATAFIQVTLPGSKLCYHGTFYTSDWTDTVTGEWRRLRNKELYALYSSSDIIRVIKSRRLRWQST
jgi:hypothetical protein